MAYELLNKNMVLARFDIVKEYGEEEVQNVKYFEQLPFWITNLQTWLSNRSAAKHRSFVKKLLFEMNADTISGFINLTNCLSLQDTLWVRKEDSELTWEQVNLFENEFSEVMTHLAFDGTGLYGMQLRTTSPELTTDGAYDKCWVKRNNKTILLKAGSIGARNAGLEPYCEVLASQFYDKFCTSIVYDIETYRKKVVSSCQSFVTMDYGYKPISLWLKDDSSIKTILQIIDKNGIDIEQFQRMIVADSVCVNSDRHFGNFGFLVHNDDYHVIQMAPAFDFNMAFSPYAEFEIDYPIYDEYLKLRGPVVGQNYIDIAKAMLTSKMRSELINLKDLELTLPDWCFEPHKYQFTKQRLDYINETKNVQIDRILGIERTFSFVEEKREQEIEKEDDEYGLT